MKSNNRISFSELDCYETCPWKHYLKYICSYKESENINLVAGNALHNAVDKALKGHTNPWISMCKSLIQFVRRQEQKGNSPLKEDETEWDWCEQLLDCYEDFFRWLNNEMSEYEVHYSEIKLDDNLEDGTRFTGYIDLVLKDKDGNYYVYDLKLTGWGWDQYRRSDKIKHYQIILYKKFFCDKEEIDPKKVYTRFLLAKRVPAKKETNCEQINITSGAKKIDNATEWANKRLRSMRKGLVMKKPGKHCKWCEFRRSKLCPNG